MMKNDKGEEHLCNTARHDAENFDICKKQDYESYTTWRDTTIPTLPLLLQGWAQKKWKFCSVVGMDFMTYNFSLNMIMPNSKYFAQVPIVSAKHLISTYLEEIWLVQTNFSLWM